MNLGRIHRLLRLITMMQSGTVRTAAELADELDISRRTLFRDLRTLSDAGIPYTHDPERGYRISPEFFLPPVNLKVTEALGLMLLAKTAARHSMQPFFRPALDAIHKLASMLPAPYREVTGGMMSNVSVEPGQTPADKQDADIFVLLQEAIDNRRVCRMTYHSLWDGGDISLRFEPYQLHFAVRTWYVIGRSVKHGDVRTFKLSRVRQLRLTDKNYRLEQPFSIEQYLGNAWSIIPEGREYDIELEFSSMVGQNVAEVIWHPTQQHELLDDGRCIMRFTVDGLGEITWWLLGYGERLTKVYQRALQQSE
jgi:predicted DNA-binding transcriptional regulator YafY